MKKPKIKIDKKGELHLSRRGVLKPVYCYRETFNKCCDYCALFAEPERIENCHPNKKKCRLVQLSLCHALYECDEDEFVDERPTDG